MNGQAAISTHRPLYLTEEEALALLEVCLLTEMENDPVKESAMRRLGELCREFIRAEAESLDETESGEHRHGRPAWERLLHRRDSTAPACA